MLPVIECLLEQWEPLKVFTRNVHKLHPNVCKEQKFKDIKRHLESADTLAKLQFLQAVLPTFQRYEKLLQAKDTKVHVVHLEMVELVISVLSKFIKPEELNGKTTTKDVTSIDFKNPTMQLQNERLSIGKKTRATLKENHCRSQTKRNSTWL